MERRGAAGNGEKGGSREWGAENRQQGERGSSREWRGGEQGMRGGQQQGMRGGQQQGQKGGSREWGAHEGPLREQQEVGTQHSSPKASPPIPEMGATERSAPRRVAVSPPSHLCANPSGPPPHTWGSAPFPPPPAPLTELQSTFSPWQLYYRYRH